MQIGHRRRRRHFVLVSQRQQVRIAAQKRAAPPLAAKLDEIGQEFVTPAAHDARHTTLEIIGVIIRPRPVLQSRDQMQTRQRRFADEEEEIHTIRRQGLLQQACNPLACRRIVAVARHVNEHRNITPPGIVTHEDTHTRLLEQKDDAASNALQILAPDLDHFLARICFHHVDQRFIAITSGRKPTSRRDRRNLPPDPRDLARRHMKHMHRIETDEHMLTNHMALPVAVTHTDEIKVGLAVQRRMTVRLGQPQR